MKCPLGLVVFTLLASLALAVPASASTAGGADLPWNGPLKTLTDNLQGPVATYSSIATMVVAAMMWGWSQSHGEGTQRLAKLIFAIPCAVFAVKILDSLGMLGAIL
ncbi:MAG TPA: TrbC/VirB2 family protein [Thermoanaerobaculia bacterium]|nr:TrbC/VirB2 family protein [Thermoanaerobaculia bacterium]